MMIRDVHDSRTHNYPPISTLYSTVFYFSFFVSFLALCLLLNDVIFIEDIQLCFYAYLILYYINLVLHSKWWI
jgi:hypothetical protein